MEQTRLAEDGEMPRFLSRLNAFNEEQDVNSSTRDVHRSSPVPGSLGINHNNLTLVQTHLWLTEHIEIEKDARCSRRRNRRPRLLQSRSNFSLLNDISARCYSA